MSFKKFQKCSFSSFTFIRVLKFYSRAIIIFYFNRTRDKNLNFIELIIFYVTPTSSLLRMPYPKTSKMILFPVMFIIYFRLWCHHYHNWFPVFVESLTQSSCTYGLIYPPYISVKPQIEIQINLKSFYPSDKLHHFGFDNMLMTFSIMTS